MGLVSVGRKTEQPDTKGLSLIPDEMPVDDNRGDHKASDLDRWNVNCKKDAEVKCYERHHRTERMWAHYNNK